MKPAPAQLIIAALSIVAAVLLTLQHLYPYRPWPEVDLTARVLFLGDSITEGAPNVPPWSRGQNLGVWGYRAAYITEQVGKLKGSEADLIVLAIGTNDLGAGADPIDVAAEVERAVVELEKVVPQATVLLVGILPGEAVDERLRGRANDYLARLGPLYFEPPLQLGTVDGLHLSSAGYEALAADLDEIVVGLLEVPTPLPERLP